MANGVRSQLEVGLRTLRRLPLLIYMRSEILKLQLRESFGAKVEIGRPVSHFEII
jgi:hypothetical protein